MNKSIKILIVFMVFVPVLAIAQQDSSSVQKKKVLIQYGRNISYDLKESTTATAVVTEKDLSHKRSINSSNILYGLIPGLQVLQNASNAWDDGATLNIRGWGTSSSSSPLVLVDGFERSLNEISADDIESISLLKDASTAIYGMRGANGVILVTTKRGVIGKPQINVSYSFNMGSPIRMPELVPLMLNILV